MECVAALSILFSHYYISRGIRNTCIISCLNVLWPLLIQHVESVAALIILSLHYFMCPTMRNTWIISCLVVLWSLFILNVECAAAFRILCLHDYVCPTISNTYFITCFLFCCEIKLYFSRESNSICTSILMTNEIYSHYLCYGNLKN